MGRMSMDRVFFCVDTLPLKILLKIYSSLLEMQIKQVQLSLTNLLLKRQQDT
jgi:RNase adaptor protein for sRNA GlmZ degradation